MLGISALMGAVQHQQNDIVRLLIQALEAEEKSIAHAPSSRLGVFKAGVNNSNGVKSTGLNQYLGDALLIACGRQGNKAMVQTLLQSNASACLEHRSANGDTALHRAVEEDPVITQLLLKANADANVLNGDGLAPQHLLPSVDILEQLYQAGADLNIADQSGKSPLWNAYEQGDIKYAEKLFSRPLYADAMTPSEKAMRK